LFLFALDFAEGK